MSQPRPPSHQSGPSSSASGLASTPHSQRDRTLDDFSDAELAAFVESAVSERPEGRSRFLHYVHGVITASVFMALAVLVGGERPADGLFSMLRFFVGCGVASVGFGAMNALIDRAHTLAASPAMAFLVERGLNRRGVRAVLARLGRRGTGGDPAEVLELLTLGRRSAGAEQPANAVPPLPGKNVARVVFDWLARRRFGPAPSLVGAGLFCVMNGSFSLFSLSGAILGITMLWLIVRVYQRPIRPEAFLALDAQLQESDAVAIASAVNHAWRATRRTRFASLDVQAEAIAARALSSLTSSATRSPSSSSADSEPGTVESALNEARLRAFGPAREDVPKVPGAVAPSTAAAPVVLDEAAGRRR